MPPRWPRKPDRKNDPAYRKLDDRMNFAVHVAIFALFNSGLWFFHNFLLASWEWLPILTLSWLFILLSHLIYIAVIADYSNTPPKST
ncbi:MAG: Pr2TM family membrane protein [Richelia sp. RM2_1_2]|nr:2TM domain-containing protein [Rivularia sp. T60_A2020_040]NJL78365.1 Pr2TM family membrane protein [Richelia sp. SM2_1_7]NJM18400.1 Pr2TM family membrane protein [Richelia sp. SM1_7_0]NJN07300.1 Pr2TM family membrane protein [Richelia sp. RM1_1_1]NJO30661.1 Pr2TM family membrane protein [Richelia sp. SL_2_1]NJO60440.1 Pr2TM family membrane protein [Richelia sp. RM2_1_2]